MTFRKWLIFAIPVTCRARKCVAISTAKTSSAFGITCCEMICPELRAIIGPSLFRCNTHKIKQDLRWLIAYRVKVRYIDSKYNIFYLWSGARTFLVRLGFRSFFVPTVLGCSYVKTQKMVKLFANLNKTHYWRRVVEPATFIDTSDIPVWPVSRWSHRIKRVTVLAANCTTKPFYYGALHCSVFRSLVLGPLMCCTRCTYSHDRHVKEHVWSMNMHKAFKWNGVVIRNARLNQ